MKVCAACGVLQPEENFSAYPYRRGAREARCKPCEKVARDAGRARYREAHREEIREKQRLYHAAHPEVLAEWRKKNADRVDATLKRWKLENADRWNEIRAAANAKRRAREYGAEAETINRFEVYERDGGRCHICHRKVARSRFHLDHLVPLSRGGDHVYENVAIAHAGCNLRRHAGRIPAQLLLLGRANGDGE